MTYFIDKIVFLANNLFPFIYYIFFGDFIISQRSKSDFVMHAFDSALRMVVLADNKASLLITVHSLIFSTELGSIILSSSVPISVN